jgi:N6-adenosine-specific RNA methylase IME4
MLCCIVSISYLHCGAAVVYYCCCACCRFVDCDVLVSEVRETSRKPDEMYPLLERLSPGEARSEIMQCTLSKVAWQPGADSLRGVAT